MQEMVFTDKTFNVLFSMGNAGYNKLVQKPMLCPLCGAYEDGITRDAKLFQRNNGHRWGVVDYECSCCKKHYLALFDVDVTAQSSSFGGFFPSISPSYENQLLEEVSPKFVDIYRQALRAEHGGDIELAAIGYRNALECLVKDYAIKELHKDRTEVIAKTLHVAIGEYLGERDLVATADVVRILGNDYAHYERKYPQHDFTLLKSYMDIFIKLIETKVMIAHPPVSRQNP